jgi:hypothetical protein
MECTEESDGGNWVLDYGESVCLDMPWYFGFSGLGSDWLGGDPVDHLRLVRDPETQNERSSWLYGGG